MAPDRGIAFDMFRFDPRTAQLWRDGREVKLTPRAAAVLHMLTARAQQLVTKRELFAEAWNGLAVSDDALTSCILELRKALGDRARHPRFIETLHRRGYRLMLPVTAIGDNKRVTARAPVAPSLPDKPSVAVLPFDTLSADPNREHLADGIVKAITVALSRARSFFVVAHERKASDVGDIRSAFGVAYLLQGSIQTSGNRIRVIAQLIETEGGAHVWSAHHDGTLDDIFDLQDRIAEKVAGALQSSIRMAEVERSRRRRPRDLSA